MEDLGGLASSLVAGVDDVRACLILSRDGLVLGSFPEDGEARARSAWLKFATLGDPERGFMQFGMETWCYVRRGPYAAFTVVGPGARPGLVIDQMEQVLLVAEEARSKREMARADVAAARSGKPRTPLHPDTRPLEEPIVVRVDVPSPSAPIAEPQVAPGIPGAEPVPESKGDGEDAGDDLDGSSLAREFGRLLQDDQGGADG